MTLTYEASSSAIPRPEDVVELATPEDSTGARLIRI